MDEGDTETGKDNESEREKVHTKRVREGQWLKGGRLNLGCTRTGRSPTLPPKCAE